MEDKEDGEELLLSVGLVGVIAALDPKFGGVVSTAGNAEPIVAVLSDGDVPVIVDLSLRVGGRLDC